MLARLNLMPIHQFNLHPVGVARDLNLAGEVRILLRVVIVFDPLPKPRWLAKDLLSLLIRRTLR